MRLKAPLWWYDDRSLLPALLSPFSILYDLANRVRWSIANPYHSRLPVICIGNFTAGGGGKTPTSIAIAKLLVHLGERPSFLTRGYGGRLIGPHIVEPEEDSADEVGDEPLLLARYAPTIVSRDRQAGAKFLETTDATVIVMDDGFQNPTLEKNLSVVTVDSRGFLGNGRVIPAGPLRASLKFQLDKTDLIMVVGEDCNSDSVVTDLKSTYDKDVVQSTYKPSGDLNWISHQPLIAFCGIARPEKFFYTLEKLGGIIYQKLEFPDHHQFASSDADRLLNLAHDTGYQLVTTEKDLIRLLHRSGSLETLRKKTQTLAIDLSLDSQTKVKLNTYIKNTLDRFLED